MQHVEALRVFLAGRQVGRLSIASRGQIYFQYDNSWLDSGFDLSPGTLPFEALPTVGPPEPFSGLHGALNDSLPDGWGLLLMDRAMQSRFGWSREDITPLDRLAYIGDRGMGALEYQPELESAAPEHAIDIAELAAASQAVLSGQAHKIVADLYIQGGSPGGARPKITVAWNPKTNACLSGFSRLPAGFEHWMVKFRGVPESRDAGRIEMAYAQMAADAGLCVPEARLMEVKVGKSKEAFFAVRRFDRSGDEKNHVLSLSGYLGADHRLPSLDYQHILAATQRLTRDVSEVARAFRLMVFNVLTHNKDDHAKNFAFIGTPAGWSLSPAYDLTYSAGMGDEHTSSVGGKGNPGLADVLPLAGNFLIKNAANVVDEVRAAVAKWPKIASKWQVSVKAIQAIGSRLKVIDKGFQRN